MTKDCWYTGEYRLQIPMIYILCSMVILNNLYKGVHLVYSIGSYKSMVSLVFNCKIVFYLSKVTIADQSYQSNDKINIHYYVFLYFNCIVFLFNFPGNFYFL